MYFSSDRNSEVRLSDNERQSAMASLGRAFAEGRLTVNEYDARVQEITRATTRGEIVPLFSDLPQNPDGSAALAENSYTAEEITAAHKSSRNMKLGVMGLTTVFSLAAVPILGYVGFPAPFLVLWLIPIVFILLYIMKVGPASWYSPSPKQIEKERLREIETANAIRNAERKAEEMARQAELKAERQRLAGELTNEAMSWAKRSIDKFKN